MTGIEEIKFLAVHCVKSSIEIIKHNYSIVNIGFLFLGIIC